MALSFPIKAQTWHHGSTRLPSSTQKAEDAEGSHISQRRRDLCQHRAGWSLTKKRKRKEKKCSGTQVSQKCPRALHVFHYWFLALHASTHWFPTVQPLVPVPSGLQSLNQRGAKSEVAHKGAKCLPHPCRIGDPHRFRAGGKIRSGPQVGKLATSPLPHRGSPPLQSEGQNQKWPTKGQNAYLTPAVSGIPTASERGAKSEVAHKWANWLPHPCRIGDPRRFRARGKITSGPQVGKVATSPLPYRGSPLLQSGGQNQKWPTSGQIGYLTPAVSGIPTAAERGAKSEVAHKWANGLPHPWRIGDPHRFRAGGKIRSGPQVGEMATSPLPYRGSPPLQSGGQNQKWPTSGQIGYLTPAVSGIPAASERGAKSEVAHKWANWLPHPCRIGDPHRFRAGGKIRSGPQVGKVATSPLPYRGSPPLQSRGQNQKWPTSGQGGYLTRAVSGIPTAAERGAKSEVAHKWANWLPHPCRIGDPRRFRAGGKIRSGPQVGKVATSPVPYRGSPPLQSGGQNQKWPTSGQIGYLTPGLYLFCIVSLALSQTPSPCSPQGIQQEKSRQLTGNCFIKLKRDTACWLICTGIILCGHTTGHPSNLWQDRNHLHNFGSGSHFLQHLFQRWTWTPNWAMSQKQTQN